MKTDLRNSGIKIIGEMAWGTHFCQFYQSKQDLIETLVAYFRQGLTDNEFCMWITAEPLRIEDATAALKKKVKNLDEYIKKGQIEILDYTQWYTKTGKFEADTVLKGWIEKEKQAIEHGFDGLRVSGNISWLEKKDWKNFCDYEEVVNKVIGKYRMLAICSYALDNSSASDIIDIVDNHRFALIRKEDKWVVLESSRQKKTEVKLKNVIQRIEYILGVTKTGLDIIDSGFNMVYINSEWKKVYGEYKGKKCYEYFMGRNAVCPDCGIRKALKTKKPVVSEEVLVKEGNRPIRVTTIPFQNEKGEWLVAKVNVDITESKKSQEILRESEERYRTLFENLMDGFAYCKMIFDKHDRPVDFIYHIVNNAFERLTGLKNVVGKKVTELIPGIKELQPEFFEIYGRVALTGKSEEFEIELKQLNIWLSIKVYSTKRRYFIAIFENITDRKKTGEQLKRLTKNLCEQNLSLQQKNAALAEVLDQIELGKEKLKHDVTANINEYVFPIVKKLKLKLKLKQKPPVKYVDLLEERLLKITSLIDMKDKLFKGKLSSRENEICDLIADGLTNKEISSLSDITLHTVEKHRRNIRKKLKLSHKDINLSSFLQNH